MTIIYQNDDFIICNKPAGQDFHDCQGTPGFYNTIKAQFKELYPVHRLDKVTSGLIIMAKNLNSEHIFNLAFQNHTIDKYYLAIANKGKKKQGLIKGDMAKSRKSAYKLLKSFENPAITQFLSFHIGAAKRLYLLKPHTGKTHQLRVAQKSISAPILGDVTYKAEPADHVYLHAYALRFTFNGQLYQFQLLPNSGPLFLNQDVKQLLATELAEPWLLPWPHL